MENYLGRSPINVQEKNSIRVSQNVSLKVVIILRLYIIYKKRYGGCQDVFIFLFVDTISNFQN